MALTVDGRRREDIGRRHLLALGSAAGMPPAASARVVDAVVAAVSERLPDLDALPFEAQRIHKLRRAVAWRLQALSG